MIAMLPRVLACLLALFPAWPAHAQGTADAELARLLAEAGAPEACAQPPADRLARVLCERRIRIGVREYYPLFATAEAGERRGFEIEVARALASKLGVEAEFVRVNAATRIPMLSDDRIDLTIATMGHNTQRDGQVRFIRPHYYQSETIIVGPKGSAVRDWKDVAGRTVCVTIGNLSNAEIVSHGARLMLFDEAGVLPDRLRNDTCVLAAQDDSFFADAFTDAAFAGRFEQKFGFAQVPWGMAVARTGSDRLAQALDLLSQIFHRDGKFLEVARAARIRTTFLEAQSAAWRRAECAAAPASCLLAPLRTEVPATPFADKVANFEKWVGERTGVVVSMPALKTAPAWSMFLNGVANSLILIAGALAATFGAALLFGAASGSRLAPLRWLARAVTVALQSSPIVLTLVISAAVAHALFAYSNAVMLGAAIVALGLANGSNAGQAIAEAMQSLRDEGAAAAGLFGRAVGRAATQIVAFLVNAAKGTPIASFIGAPELLATLTDITSFSSGRVTTYSFLLLFYIVVVMVVVWLCNRLRDALERRQATA